MRFLKLFLALICGGFLFSGCNTVGGVGEGLNNSTRVSFTKRFDMNPGYWENSDEVDRTWQAAFVRVPLDDGSTLKTRVRDLEKTPIGSDKKYPLVIWLHGCSGIGSWTFRYMNFFADNGYAVIAPASFARQHYAKSCDARTNKGGLYDWTLKMRVTDARNAVRKAKTLEWVNTDNIFLFGYSEGATTSAILNRRQDEDSVTARVVIANTCVNRDIAYAHGIKAPESEPVLALLGANDPWFKNRWKKGDCSEFLSSSNGSKSIVYRSGSLANKHNLLDYKQPQKEVLNFLAKNRK